MFLYLYTYPCIMHTLLMGKTWGPHGGPLILFLLVYILGPLWVSSSRWGAPLQVYGGPLLLCCCCMQGYSFLTKGVSNII